MTVPWLIDATPVETCGGSPKTDNHLVCMHAVLYQGLLFNQKECVLLYEADHFSGVQDVTWAQLVCN